MKALLISTTLILSGAATWASAQVDQRQRSRDPAETGSLTVRPRAPVDAYGRSAAPQQACVPWCPQDQNPCDPPVFKIADGRCSFNDR